VDYGSMLTQLDFDRSTLNYRYDGLGNRVAKIENGAEMRYVSGLAETDAAGNITSYYVYGLGLISKITPTNQAYYYRFDGIGSTIAMTDSSGNIVNKYAYDAFGKVLDQIEVISNPFKFVGGFGVMDEGNGLLYMRARYYDPEIGRFISKDPIGFVGGLNLYTYVGNNPINWIDPLGLQTKPYPPGSKHPEQNITDVSKGKLWVSTMVKIGGITVIGLGVIYTSPVIVGVGAGIELGYLAYEAYYAYLAGRKTIENEKFERKLEESCNGE
jgi:RHS repeat-associated protein